MWFCTVGKNMVTKSFQNLNVTHSLVWRVLKLSITFTDGRGCYCPGRGLDYCLTNSSLATFVASNFTCKTSCYENKTCVAWTWSAELNAYNYNCELFSFVPLAGKYKLLRKSANIHGSDILNPFDSLTLCNSFISKGLGWPCLCVRSNIYHHSIVTNSCKFQQGHKWPLGGLQRGRIP